MKRNWFIFYSLIYCILFLTAVPSFNKSYSQTCSNTPASNNSVTNLISVPASGTYKVWTRILAPDSTNNSVFLQIDGGCAFNIGDSASITASAWTWVDYQDGASESAVFVSLTAGDHTVKLTQREPGVGIDKILFTSDSACQPAGVGDNCPLPTGTPSPSGNPTPVSSPTPTPAALNFLTNSGFESAGDWKSGYFSGTGSITRTTADRHTGDYSYSLQGSNSSSSGQVYSDISNQINVEAGKTYTFSAWFKGSNAYLVLKWFDINGTLLSFISFTLPNSGQWIQTVQTAVAPAGAAKVWVFVQNRNNASATYFDDLFFSDGSTTLPTPIPTSTPTPVPTNTPIPTVTPTPVPTATPTPTPTPIPTSTPTPVPTNTPIPTVTPTPVPTNTPTPAQVINGLQAVYYNNIDFTGSTVSRVDPAVNFNWGTGAPANSISPTTFSAVWTGFVVPQYTQTYTFYAKTDDGARLWVNGSRLVNDWTNHSAKESKGTISLTAGVKYAVRMEYFQNYGSALAQLSWSSGSQAKQIIPQGRLYAK